MVLSLSNVDPIPDGSVLYSCWIAIARHAPLGPYALVAGNSLASDPSGNPIELGAVDGQVFVGGPPTTLNHFKCYKAKDLKNPRFVPTVVGLTDQFDVNDGDFEVKKPFLMCNPTDKNGEGIINAAEHLTCYKVKGPKLYKNARPQVEVGDQFGTLQLEATKPFLLCVPSAKTVLP